MCVGHSGSRGRLRTGTWVHFDVGEGILSRYVMQSTSLILGDEPLDSHNSFPNATAAIKFHHVLKLVVSVSFSGLHNTHSSIARSPS